MISTYTYIPFLDLSLLTVSIFLASINYYRWVVLPIISVNNNCVRGVFFFMGQSNFFVLIHSDKMIMSLKISHHDFGKDDVLKYVAEIGGQGDSAVTVAIVVHCTSFLEDGCDMCHLPLHGKFLLVKRRLL